ncbi:MAG: hypothetical protein ACJ8F3_14745 [Xanthobacteraceae bacterium]
MADNLTDKVVAWACEIATCASRLPSRQAREDYLDERRRELVTGSLAEGLSAQDADLLADACLEAARRIMFELLARSADLPQGRA